MKGTRRHIPGDEIVDFWGDSFVVERVEPNHVRGAPDYVCRDARGRLVSVPAQNVRGEDMAAHRADALARREHVRTELEAIRGGLIDEWEKPWPGMEFAKVILGRAIDGAIREVDDEALSR